MKILHVITSLRTGGAEHLLVDLLPRLRNAGHEVGVALFDGTRTPFLEALEGQGIAVHPLGMGARDMHNPLLLPTLWKFLRQHPCDIVHTHNTPCQLLTALAIGASRAALVTTEHNTSNRRRAWRGWRAADRWMYGRYQHIVCVSGEVEKSLRKSLCNERISQRTCTIPNGIDVSAYRDAMPSYECRQLHGGKKLVVMVAAFRPEKDQATLLRAMQRLTGDFHLLLVGEGQCMAECQTLAETLGVRQRVSFLGNRTGVAALLKAADAVVMSSHHEGLSLSCLEGMASGRPFIASDVRGLHDIVEGAGLLFPEGDDVRLAEAIRRVCSDKTLAAAVAERCQARATQHDISRMAESYLDLYENIFNAKR